VRPSCPTVFFEAYQAYLRQDYETRLTALDTNKQTPWPLVRKRNIPTATCRRNLVSTFVERGMSRSQRGIPYGR
jgi:hypothetical protein